MSALDLVMAEFSDDPKKREDVDQQAVAILRDFLQPDSKISVDSASPSILALLLDENLEGMAVWLLGELFIELAEQIPYFHLSQVTLIQLLQQMGPSPKVTTKVSNI